MMKILIAEDNNISQLLLVTYCNKIFKNPDISCADNGLEALGLVTRAFLQNSYFDLILCDVLMPKLSGDNLIKDLKLYERVFKWKHKIIMISGVDLDLKLFQSDAYLGYLTKPVTINKFKDECVRLSILD